MQHMLYCIPAESQAFLSSLFTTNARGRSHVARTSPSLLISGGLLVWARKNP